MVIIPRSQRDDLLKTRQFCIEGGHDGMGQHNKHNFFCNLGWWENTQVSIFTLKCNDASTCMMNTYASRSSAFEILGRLWPRLSRWYTVSTRPSFTTPTISHQWLLKDRGRQFVFSYVVYGGRQVHYDASKLTHGTGMGSTTEGERGGVISAVNRLILTQSVLEKGADHSLKTESNRMASSL